MGSGRSDTYSMRATYASTSEKYQSTKSAKEVFKESKLHQALSPKNIVMRESCDSEDNPNSVPVIVAVDVTGSMGVVAHEIAKTGLERMVMSIYDHSPINDPHIMFMAIGDVKSDDAPLQVSQFEADNRIIEQLTQIYVEGGGGGNATESYDFPWYFAAYHTKTDSWDKRQKKGYIFTMGDEGFPTGITRNQLIEFVGDTAAGETGYTANELLEAAQERYNVFHIIIAEGSFCRRSNGLRNVTEEWQQHMGKRALVLTNYKHMPELIVTAIAVSEGEDPEEIINTWEDPSIRNTLRVSFGF